MSLDRQPSLTGQLVALRPLRASDWEGLFAVACDPLVWEQHPLHERWQEKVFRPYFEYLLDGGGTLVVIDLASGAICGSSTFSNYRPDGAGLVEIGSTFLGRDYWGTGYNREMKRLMLRHALAHVGVVEFLIGEHNMRSRKAMEKIGGILTERTHVAELPGGRTALHLIYEIDRENFASGPLSA